MKILRVHALAAMNTLRPGQWSPAGVGLDATTQRHETPPEHPALEAVLAPGAGEPAASDIPCACSNRP